jgi:hypothetical protein
MTAPEELKAPQPHRNVFYSQIFVFPHSLHG